MAFPLSAAAVCSALAGGLSWKSGQFGGDAPLVGYEEKKLHEHREREVA
jgi:hypothetical protein